VGNRLAPVLTAETGANDNDALDIRDTTRHVSMMSVVRQVDEQMDDDALAITGAARGIGAAAARLAAAGGRRVALLDRDADELATCVDEFWWTARHAMDSTAGAPVRSEYCLGAAPQEVPWLMPRRATVLDEGMVIAIEPGADDGGFGLPWSRWSP
jgi:Xaa-Pro aminopeptidase